MKTLNLGESNLTLKNIEEVARFFRKIKLSGKALKNVKKGRKILEKKAHSKDLHYAINTGFGDLCNVKIPLKDMKKLQGFIT